MAITDEFLTNAIGTCTAEVFSTMLGMELVQEPAVVEIQSSGSGEGVLALVGVAGAWSGTGVLQCEARLARKLCAALLMMEVGDEGVTEDVLDAVADERLKTRIIGIKDQWQPIAYEVSGHLCGVEAAPHSGQPPMKRGRKSSNTRLTCARMRQYRVTYCAS